MVGTALRAVAVRNDAPVMLRLWYFAARSASAPYHLSHWVQYAGSCCLCCFLIFISSVTFAAPRLAVPPEGVAFGEVSVGSAEHARDLKGTVPHAAIECCQCESVASSNVASFQLAIGKWNWILATMATFLRPAPRHPPRSAPSRPVHLARRPASRRKKYGIMLSVDETPWFHIPLPLSRVCAVCGAAVAWVAREPAAGGSGA